MVVQKIKLEFWWQVVPQLENRAVDDGDDDETEKEKENENENENEKEKGHVWLLSIEKTTSPVLLKKRFDWFVECWEDNFATAAAAAFASFAVLYWIICIRLYCESQSNNFTVFNFIQCYKSCSSDFFPGIYAFLFLFFHQIFWLFSLISLASF